MAWLASPRAPRGADGIAAGTRSAPSRLGGGECVCTAGTDVSSLCPALPPLHSAGLLWRSPKGPPASWQSKVEKFLTVLESNHVSED